MASSERKRQQQLARKAAKRKQHNQAIRRAETEARHGMSLGRQLALAAAAPIHECLMPAGLFGTGIGTVVVSRKLPNGNIVVAGILLDVWCLGVKNAFLRVESEYEYPSIIQGIGERESLIPIDPECARKLVEGAEAYAADLGFAPHPDYDPARRIFGDIDKAACTMSFEFGREGKPYYVSGPYDSTVRSRKIVETLAQRCGPNGFHYVVELDGSPDLAGIRMQPIQGVADQSGEAQGEEEPGEEALSETDPSLQEDQPEDERSWLSRLPRFGR